MDNFKYYNVDYCKLVKSAAKGNIDSFLEILMLSKKLDGGPAEINLEVVWSIFNLWSDSKFNNLMTRLDSETKNYIAKYLICEPLTYPITNLDYYFSEYYPNTWSTIKEMIDIEKKK